MKALKGDAVVVHHDGRHGPVRRHDTYNIASTIGRKQHVGQMAQQFMGGPRPVQRAQLKILQNLVDFQGGENMGESFSDTPLDDVPITARIKCGLCTTRKARATRRHPLRTVNCMFSEQDQKKHEIGQIFFGKPIKETELYSVILELIEIHIITDDVVGVIGRLS